MSTPACSPPANPGDWRSPTWRSRAPTSERKKDRSPCNYRVCTPDRQCMVLALSSKTAHCKHSFLQPQSSHFRLCDPLEKLVLLAAAIMVSSVVTTETQARVHISTKDN